MKATDPLTEASDAAAPTGHRLATFELQRVAHRDAEHVVYQAWDHALRVPVAIKEYLPSKRAQRRPDGQVEPLPGRPPDAFRRGLEAFVDEARLLARCEHPSLVRVHQLLRVHGTAYWVMPWFAGRTLLQARQQRTAPPDEASLRRLLAALLGALEAFQRIGGVHGGVDPSRILLGDEGRVLLLGPTLRRQGGAGTDDLPDARPAEPGFVAPELSKPPAERRIGPWTDLFALSRVLRFQLTGLLPPPDGSTPEPLAATVEQLYFDAPQVRYDARLLQALDAAASPAIDQRPQTVAEFRQWLAQGARPPMLRAAPAGPESESLPTGFGMEPPRAAPGLEPPRAATGPQPPLQAPMGPPRAVSDIDPPRAAPDVAPPVVDTPRTDGPADDEAVDPATIDLIRRVLESIPERSEAPAAATLADAPALDLPDPPLPAAPRRGAAVVRRLLAGAALGGVAALIAWSWPWSPDAPAPATMAAAPAGVPAPVPVAAPAKAAPVAAAPVEAAAEAAPPTPAPAPATSTMAPAMPALGPPAARTAAPRTPPAAEPPAERAAAGRAVAGRATSAEPRRLCGARTDFALYRCMQQQCAKSRWKSHPQCVRFRATDRVG